MNNQEQESAAHDVTRLLRQGADGDEASMEAVFALVYRDLRDRAEGYICGERAGHTLQATALVHEAYMRLVRLDDFSWAHREHFFAVAASCMRHVLVDHARRRRAAKRGADATAQALLEEHAVCTAPTGDLLDLDEALERLGARDARKARVAELKLFAGLEHEGVALVLNVSVPTVERDWRFSRAFLRRELDGGEYR